MAITHQTRQFAVYDLWTVDAEPLQAHTYSMSPIKRRRTTESLESLCPSRAGTAGRRGPMAAPLSTTLLVGRLYGEGARHAIGRRRFTLS